MRRFCLVFMVVALLAAALLASPASAAKPESPCPNGETCKPNIHHKKKPFTNRHGVLWTPCGTHKEFLCKED